MTSKTETVADLVERLFNARVVFRHAAEPESPDGQMADLLFEAASTPTSLEAERDRLREAIRAMWDEYMLDEECDYTKINALIELAYEQAGLAALTPEPKP